MDLWLGKGIVEVSYITAISFALFGTTFLYSSMLSTIANGLAMMKIQTITYIVAVFLKIVLLLLFYTQTIWNFVVWVNMVILLPYIVFQQVALNRYLKSCLKPKIRNL